jgi:hypothetical protein
LGQIFGIEDAAPGLVTPAGNANADVPEFGHGIVCAVGRSFREFRDFLEVGYELSHFGVTRLIVGSSENRRWVYGGHDVRREGGFEEFAVALRYAERAAEEGLSSGSAEADNDLGECQDRWERLTGGDSRPDASSKLSQI